MNTINPSYIKCRNYAKLQKHNPEYNQIISLNWNIYCSCLFQISSPTKRHQHLHHCAHHLHNTGEAERERRSPYSPQNRKTIINISTAHIHINITSKVITHSFINRKKPFVPVPPVTKKNKHRPNKPHFIWTNRRQISLYTVRLCLDSHIYQLIWHINLWLFWYSSVAIEVPYSVGASSAAIRIVDAYSHTTQFYVHAEYEKYYVNLECVLYAICFICAYLLW